MRYRLRTLLILLAIMPPLLWIGWTNYEAWKAEQERQAARERLLRERRDLTGIRIRLWQVNTGRLFFPTAPPQPMETPERAEAAERADAPAAPRGVR